MKHSHPSSIEEAQSIIKDQHEMINRLRKACADTTHKSIAEEPNDSESSPKHRINTDDGQNVKSNYLELELKYQTDRADQLKRAWINSQSQIDHLKQLVTEIEQKSEMLLKEDNKSWQQIVNSMKVYY